MKRVLLFSGGMDSVALWRVASLGGIPLDLLYVRIGHAYEERELRALSRIGEWARRRCIPYSCDVAQGDGRGRLADAETGHIPLRNDYLVSVAVTRGADVVWIGAVAGEGSRDKSSRFYRSASQHYGYLTGRRIDVLAPAQRSTKSQLLGRLLSTPGGLELFRLTRSCYDLAETDEGAFVGCGTCAACYYRWVATQNNAVNEKLVGSPAQWARERLRDKRVIGRALRNLSLARLPGFLRNHADGLRAMRRATAKGD